MTTSKKAWVLAGDIGGTKTNLGLFERAKGRPLLRVQETYPSAQAKGLEDIISVFLRQHPARVFGASFGIAGPVEGGRVKTTNLPWELSEAALAKRFRWKAVSLINDLVATVMAIPSLTGRETVLLNKGKRAVGENIGLVAPGTGLGMALLVRSDNGYIPLASEGGHADFGPNDSQEMALWQYLRRRFGHVSAERVLSGPGLVNIYCWLRDSNRYKEPRWLKKKTAEGDPARAITEAAIHRGTPIAVAALKRFVAILGSVAGNVALTGMTTGGMYLGGGIPPKILEQMRSPIFLEAFVGKGRFQPLLEKIPIRVILNDKAALLGAAVHALSG